MPMAAQRHLHSTDVPSSFTHKQKLENNPSAHQEEKSTQGQSQALGSCRATAVSELPDHARTWLKHPDPAAPQELEAKGETLYHSLCPQFQNSDGDQRQNDTHH